MKSRHILATALAVTLTAAHAETATTPAYQLSGMVSVANNYLFKGLTQTWDRPALQASLDLSTRAGLWASVWASNVSEKLYAGAQMEIDLSAGYKKQIDEDWSVGGGVMSVFYPGGNYNKIRYATLPSQTYDFTEANIGVSWRWLSLRYSYSLTDILGFNEKTGYTSGTRGSTYLDLNADIPVTEQTVLNLHVGHQDVAASLQAPTVGGTTNPDFTDYKIGVTYNLSDGSMISLAAAWNSNRAFFDKTASNLNLNDTKDVGKQRVLIAYTKPFSF